MTKSELKSGIVVETRNGAMYMVVGDTLCGNDGWMRLSEYYEDLTHADIKNNGFDIINVYRRMVTPLNYAFNKSKLNLIWNRNEEPKEMTLKEISEELGYPVKVIG